MPADDARPQPGLNRARLVDAALDLVQEHGLEALTMRTLADRLEVKAASLYWHVRDRDELLELLAATLLKEVRLPSTPADWRQAALAICTALEVVSTRRRDAARILLAMPQALDRSEAHARLSSVLAEAGVSLSLALETATMLLAWVLVSSMRPADAPPAEGGRPILLAVDGGSRGVTLRAGPANMPNLIRAAHDPTAATPAIIQGDRVVVRRLRGGRQGELELNPAYAWRFKVQAPTWNTVLDLAGLDVREIQVDSGAARVECLLPPPRGVVPIDISSGVVGVRVRRPPSVQVVAEIHTGVLQLRLDRRSIAATASDTTWESAPGAASPDHYALTVHSGTARVALEEDPSIPSVSAPQAAPVARAGLTDVLNVVLDGVAARLR